MADFASLLTQYRERAGLSQAALARRVKLTHSFVSRLERSEREPSRTTVLALARALGLSAEERDTFLLAAGYAPINQNGRHTSDLLDVLNRLAALIDEARQLAQG